jgi:hypothetical protein
MKVSVSVRTLNTITRWFVLSAAAAWIVPAAFGQAGPPCSQPDNGSGTADFPPIGCDYPPLPPEMWHIIEGLPPRSSIDIDGPITDFRVLSRLPGGTLKGEVQVFDAVFHMQLVGTGVLEGYERSISLPLSS